MLLYGDSLVPQMARYLTVNVPGLVPTLISPDVVCAFVGFVLPPQVPVAPCETESAWIWYPLSVWPAGQE